MNDLEKYSTLPATRRTLRKMQRQTALIQLLGTTITAITDNSTGTAANGYLVPVTQRVKFAHVTGSDLAQKAAFDTAHTKVNNAIKILAGALIEISTPLAIALITQGDGAAGTPGTIAAMDKTCTGTDGATAVALSRAGGNAAILGWRDNLATVVTSLNRLNDFFGLAKVAIPGLSTARANLVLANKASTGTAVDNTGDAMSKAHADAQLTRVADAVAAVAVKIAALRTYINANKADVTP